jgi:hypothetical protein
MMAKRVIKRRKRLTPTMAKLHRDILRLTRSMEALSRYMAEDDEEAAELDDFFDYTNAVLQEMEDARDQQEMEFRKKNNLLS